MTATSPSVRIGGLDKLDKRLFEQELNEEVSFEQEELTSDKAGEPVTIIAVISLTALGIKTLAHWLMKERKRGRVEYTVEVERPNGERVKQTFVLDTYSSTPPSAEVIEKLGASLQLDPQLIADALQGATA
jgi:hypothetical protein